MSWMLLRVPRSPRARRARRRCAWGKIYTLRLRLSTRHATVITAHRLTGPVAALAALLFACPTVEAGPPTETLRVVLAQANAVLVAPLTKDRPAQRFTEVQRLFNGVFEFRGAAAVAL